MYIVQYTVLMEMDPIHVHYRYICSQLCATITGSLSHFQFVVMTMIPTQKIT